MLWIIEKIVKKGDYLYAVVPKHPNASTNGYVLHHRIVVENKLNRLLTNNEVVHHKDENKKNNTPENLEVITRSEHSKLHAKRAEQLKKECSFCKKIIYKTKRQLYRKINTFCSRSCNAKFNRLHNNWTGKQKKI